MIRFTLRLSLPILLVIAPLFTSACRSTGVEEPLFAQPAETGPPPRGRGVSGYNEPLDWQNGVGLRAVARGQILLISVKNLTDEPLYIEPEAFRLIMPEQRLYELQADREDLSGFLPRPVEPGEGELYSVGMPQALGDLTQYALVLNYPPRQVLLRTFIEPVATTH